MGGEETGVQRFHARDNHGVHQRRPQNRRLGAGNAARFGKQHVRRPHIDGHLVGKRHSKQLFISREGRLQGLAQFVIPSGEHAQQRVRSGHLANSRAKGGRIAAADSTGHDEIDFLVSRKMQLFPGL